MALTYYYYYFFSLKNESDIYSENLLQFVAQYQFTLAIENAVCDDYITEKLWRPLMVGSIPIYFGSPTIRVSLKE